MGNFVSPPPFCLTSFFSHLFKLSAFKLLSLQDADGVSKTFNLSLETGSRLSLLLEALLLSLSHFLFLNCRIARFD